MQGDAFIILKPEAADALDYGYAGFSHKIGAGKVSHVVELIDIAGKMDLVDPNAAELQAQSSSIFSCWQFHPSLRNP